MKTATLTFKFRLRDTECGEVFDALFNTAVATLNAKSSVNRGRFKINAADAPTLVDYLFERSRNLGRSLHQRASSRNAAVTIRNAYDALNS